MPDTNKERRINEYWDLLKDSVRHRLNFTLQTTAVIAVILMILSISGVFSDYGYILITAKVLLSMFLFFIPISSFLYIYEVNKSGVSARKALEKEIGKKLLGSDKNWIDWLGIYFPWIFLVILFLGVIITIILLWV